MRKILTFIFCIFIYEAYAQVSNYYEHQPYKINIDIGAKYQIPDYLGGFSLGVSANSPAKRIGFSLYSDIMFGQIAFTESGGLDKLYFQSYLETDYGIIIRERKSLRFGVGWGWVKGISTENNFANYPIITASLKYVINRFAFELRSNLPYKSKAREWGGPNNILHPFPSLGIFYKIGCGKKQ